MFRFCDKRFTIGCIAVVDMMFGAILFSLYLRQLLFFYIDSSANAFSPPSLRLIILFPLTLNAFQVIMAYHLLTAINKYDALRSIAKSTMWFQTSAVILTFLCLKFFLMILFNSRENDSLAMTLLFTETIFKSFSMYLVKAFLEELRSQINHPTSVHYYNVYIPPNQEDSGIPFSSNENCAFTSASPYFNYPSQYPLNLPNYVSKSGPSDVSKPVFV